MVDGDRFGAYLIEKLDLSHDVVVTGIESMSGGYNNSMTKVSVDIDGTAKDFTVRSELPADRALVTVDRHREWAILNLVAECLKGASCPPLVGFDPDGRDLGRPSMVLEYVPGTPLQAMSSAAPSTDRTDFVHRLLDVGATIHRCDITTLSDAVERPVSWGDYIADLIQDWRSAEAEYVEPDPFFRYAAAWLERHQPPEAPLGLVHGDLQACNVLIGDDEHSATTVVDWEFAHIGDPREDLGWLQVMELMSPPVLYGLDPEASCSHYRDRSGLSEDIINPDTISYFGILALGRPLRSVMKQTRSFVEGRNRSLVMPYAMAALASSRLRAFEEMGRLSKSPALVHGVRS